MKYETREEFLTDYNRLKSHITERHHDCEAICQTVPYDYYTISYETVDDCVRKEYLDFDDSDVYDSFFNSEYPIQEYLSTQQFDVPVVSTCYLRKCMMMIYFDTNTIERYENSEHCSTERYLITPDSRVYDI